VRRHPGGAVRRDAEPHRGAALVWLADLAFVLAMLSFLLLFPIVIALPLASVVRVLAGRDVLSAMRPTRRIKRSTFLAPWVCKICI